MRVKYPIENLENRIEVVASSLPNLTNLSCIGYALVHCDFTKRYSGLFSVVAYPKYIILSEEENVIIQKDYIIVGLDFILEYLNDEWVNELIESLCFRNDESNFGRWREKVKEIILNYIADNKEEFSDVYLELILG